MTNSLGFWMAELDKQVKAEAPRILLCNKFDLPQAKQNWANKEFHEKISELHFSRVLTTSARQILP